MPNATNGEFENLIFNTDKDLFNALTGKNETCVNAALHHLKQDFIEKFEYNKYYKNKWYADDALMIAISQFHKYLNNGKFILGKVPLVSALHIFFKRRMIDFGKDEIKTAPVKHEAINVDENFFEKMQAVEIRKKIINNAIALLRDNCRRILRMKYFDELTMQQIAETIQVKPDGLYVEASRCRKELKNILIDKFNFPPHGLWV